MWEHVCKNGEQGFIFYISVYHCLDPKRLEKNVTDPWKSLEALFDEFLLAVHTSTDLHRSFNMGHGTTAQTQISSLFACYLKL